MTDKQNNIDDHSHRRVFIEGTEKEPEKSKVSNFLVRSLTGVLFVAVMVGGITLSPASFGVLFLLITCLSVWEFAGLVNQRHHINVNRFIATVAGGCLFAGAFGYAAGVAGGSALLVPWLLSVIYLIVSELYLKRPSPMSDWAYALMSQLYVALPFALLCSVEFTDKWLVLAIFVFLWANDTGAYCTGSLLGRHKLFPRISPGKSWEGSIGGGVLCLLLSQLIAFCGPAEAVGECGFTVFGLTPLKWAGFALIVVVFGTWGDLVESLLKRQLGIKDSGHILPGHGGMLDRFDSSLLAIPAIVIYLSLVMTL